MVLYIYDNTRILCAFRIVYFQFYCVTSLRVADKRKMKNHENIKVSTQSENSTSNWKTKTIRNLNGDLLLIVVVQKKETHHNK